MFELFRNVIILARDTGMQNGRELYRIRTENLDWNNRIIFVPESKTVDRRRVIPMSDRAYEVLRARAAGQSERWLFPSARSRSGHLMDLGKQFRMPRRKAQFSEDRVLYCARHDLRDRGPKQYRQSRGGERTMGHKDSELPCNISIQT